MDIHYKMSADNKYVQIFYTQLHFMVEIPLLRIDRNWLTTNEKAELTDTYTDEEVEDLINTFTRVMDLYRKRCSTTLELVKESLWGAYHPNTVGGFVVVPETHESISPFVIYRVYVGDLLDKQTYAA